MPYSKLTPQSALEPNPMLAPMADLEALLRPHQAALQDAFRTVAESGRFILGPHLVNFESQMARRIGVRHALGVSSGTDALALALAALDVGPGDRVITTPYSFRATASVILRCGATPVFIDIDPKTYNLCPEALRAWMTNNPALLASVKVVLPVHLFGEPADLGALGPLAQEMDAHLVEDAAQALDADVANLGKAGSVGTIGCFSFYPTKNLGALGDGGLVVTNNDEIAARLAALRSHEPSEVLSGNHRLDELQAACLSVLLSHVEIWTQARRKHALAYDAALTGARGVAPVRSRGHVCHQYVLRVTGDREALRADLGRQGVESAIYYPQTLPAQLSLRSFEGAPTLRHAESACGTTLAIPVHPALSETAHLRVVQALTNV
jgi:dTDP-4-amino-4,6-dideoxygalactose transaminase